MFSFSDYTNYSIVSNLFTCYPTYACCSRLLLKANYANRFCLFNIQIYGQASCFLFYLFLLFLLVFISYFPFFFLINNFTIYHSTPKRKQFHRNLQANGMHDTNKQNKLESTSNNVANNNGGDFEKYGWILLMFRLKQNFIT